MVPVKWYQFYRVSKNVKEFPFIYRHFPIFLPQTRYLAIYFHPIAKPIHKDILRRRRNKCVFYLSVFYMVLSTLMIIKFFIGTTLTLKRNFLSYYIKRVYSKRNNVSVRCCKMLKAIMCKCENILRDEFDSVH